MTSATTADSTHWHEAIHTATRTENMSEELYGVRYLVFVIVKYAGNANKILGKIAPMRTITPNTHNDWLFAAFQTPQWSRRRNGSNTQTHTAPDTIHHRLPQCITVRDDGSIVLWTIALLLSHGPRRNCERRTGNHIRFRCKREKGEEKR